MASGIPARHQWEIWALKRGKWASEFYSAEEEITFAHHVPPPPPPPPPIQAHMQARYVILRVLLQEAPGLVTIERVTGSDGYPDATIKLDRSQIETVGKQAIGDFLQKLQVIVVTKTCVVAC